MSESDEFLDPDEIRSRGHLVPRKSDITDSKVRQLAAVTGSACLIGAATALYFGGISPLLHIILIAYVAGALFVGLMFDL